MKLRIKQNPFTGFTIQRLNVRRLITLFCIKTYEEWVDVDCMGHDLLDSEDLIKFNTLDEAKEQMKKMLEPNIFYYPCENKNEYNFQNETYKCYDGYLKIDQLIAEREYYKKAFLKEE